MKKLIDRIPLQFGHHGDNVIVALELASFEPTATLDDMHQETRKILEEIKMFAEFELYFGKSLKTLLSNVSAADADLPDGRPGPEQAQRYERKSEPL